MSEGNEEGIREMAESMVRACAEVFENTLGWVWARFDGAARVESQCGEGEASFGVAIDWVSTTSQRTPIFKEAHRIGIGNAQIAEIRGAARATEVLLSIFARLLVI